jgi:hypothetical protein
MSILYRILQGFLIYFLPLVVLLFSLSTSLVNPDIHKKTLQNTNFYNKLGSEIAKFNTQEKTTTDQNQKNFWNLYGKDLANPVFLQDFFEQNIDSTTGYLAEKNPNWAFYLPASKIENEAKSTKEIIESKKSEIPECTAESLEKVKNVISSGQNINLQNNFCLPKEVKNGQQSLTKFLQDNNLENSLNSMITDKTDQFKTSIANSFSSSFAGFFGFMRSYLTKIRTIAPTVIIVMSLVLLIMTILAGTVGRKPLHDLRTNLWHIAISVLSLSALFVLILGGIAFVNSWFGEFIFGQKVPEIVNISLIQWLWFLFDLVSLAVWSGFGLLILSLVMLFLPKGSVEQNNKKLQKSENSYRKFPKVSRPENLRGVSSNYQESTENSNYDQENEFGNSLENGLEYDKDGSENYPTKNNSKNYQNPYQNPNNINSQNYQNSNSKSNFSQNQNIPNSGQNSSQLNPNNNYTFDEQFQQETENIYRQPPIRPNISGVILPHEKYEVPTQIPRNRPIPPKVPKSSHPSDNANPYEPYGEKISPEELKNPENVTNFVMIEDESEARNEAKKTNE